MAIALTTDAIRKRFPEVSKTYMSCVSSSGKRSMTGQPPCVGLYWHRQGEHPTTAFMLVHYSADFSEHYLAEPLAAQGYGVLGFATRYRAMEESFMLENALDDIQAGVEWLLSQTPTTNLVFIGTSGGGSLLSAYQARAEKTAAPGAKAFVFLNAHPGRADVLTDWLDPSVLNEADPTQRDPSLDMYNPVNGPPFSQNFQSRYRAAQKARNHRISAWAKAELQRLNEAGISDRIFNVERTNADLRFLDPAIDPSERPTPACFQGDPETANNGVGFLARCQTLKTWLSMWSLEDSQSRFKHQAATFSLPTIVIQGLGDVGVFPAMARDIYSMIGSPEKDIRFVKGAHCFDDSQESLDNVVALIATWTREALDL
jgi:pimeloyl-ACP methyl ester carboxylesterase